MKSLATILMLGLVGLMCIGTRVSHAQPGFGQLWEKSSANPLFSILGPSGSWNSVPTDKGFILGHGLKDDNQYKLYLGGFNGSKFSVGLVTSPGLESGWEYYAGNPVLQPGTAGEWDEVGAGAPVVIKDEGIYKMWYTGIENDPPKTERIGYATSPDGINWTKYANNPILDVVDGSWESEGIWMPYVIKEGNGYKMWYGGFSVGEGDTIHFNIGFATSPDGIAWTRADENPVLTGSSTPGAWNQYYVSQPVVLYDEGKYLMWYIGSTSRAIPWETGFAISDDGIHWTQDDEHNPVLPCSNPPAWDDKALVPVQGFKDNGTYSMLYLGTNFTTVFAAGLATLTLTSIEDHSAEIAASFVLYPNYPNPFNPSTTIRYLLPKTATVELTIFNLVGQEVRRLVNEIQGAGEKVAVWDGRDHSGKPVSSGIYVYQLRAGDYLKSQKMLLVR